LIKIPIIIGYGVGVRIRGRLEGEEVGYIIRVGEYQNPPIFFLVMNIFS
jgi:hypothetical protein